MKPSTKLKLIMWETGSTKKEIADELSVSPAYVNKILNELDNDFGYEPNTKLAKQVKAKILNILQNEPKSLVV